MGTAMSPKERVHAILQGKPHDRSLSENFHAGYF